VDPASGLRGSPECAWTGPCSGNGFRLIFTWIRPLTCGFVAAGQRRPPRRRSRQSAVRTAVRPSATDHAICRGVSRVSRRRQRQLGDLREGDFGRVLPAGGPGPGWAAEGSRAVSRCRRPRPTRWAHPNPLVSRSGSDAPGTGDTAGARRNHRRPPRSTTCVRRGPSKQAPVPISAQHGGPRPGCPAAFQCADGFGVCADDEKPVESAPWTHSRSPARTASRRDLRRGQIRDGVQHPFARRTQVRHARSGPKHLARHRGQQLARHRPA
jgi:hypothetical protein